MIHTMRHKDESIDLFFRKKPKSRDNDSFTMASTHSMSFTNSDSFDSYSPLEDNYMNTKMRMKDLL